MPLEINLRQQISPLKEKVNLCHCCEWTNVPNIKQQAKNQPRYQHENTLCKIDSNYYYQQKHRKYSFLTIHKFLGSLGRQRFCLNAIYLKWSAEKDQHTPAVEPTVTSIPQDPFDTISLMSIHRQLDVSLLSDTYRDKWVKIHSNGQR